MVLTHDIGEAGTAVRILMADDDEEDFYIFSVALDEIPTPVILSRVIDGEQLMNKLEQERPDILLLDLFMPCKNGKECLQEIRSQSRYDDLPILICTSFTDPSSIDFCFKGGANLYLIKPNSIRELGNLLQEVLLNRHKLISHISKSEFILDARID